MRFAAHVGASPPWPEAAVAVMAADSEQGGTHPKGIRKQRGLLPDLIHFCVLPNRLSVGLGGIRGT
eukprot:6534914-Prymnesium_polylepis.1